MEDDKQDSPSSHNPREGRSSEGQRDHEMDTDPDTTTGLHTTGLSKSKRKRADSYEESLIVNRHALVISRLPSEERAKLLSE